MMGEEKRINENTRKIEEIKEIEKIEEIEEVEEYHLQSGCPGGIFEAHRTLSSSQLPRWEGGRVFA